MKIRNENIINKLKKIQPKTYNKIETDDSTLKKYEALKADLCPMEDKTEILCLWLLVSFGVLGFFIFFDVLMSFFSDRTEFNFDFSSAPYIIATIFILAANIFLFFYLNSKITQSSLTIDEKIDRLENNKLVSGVSLFFIKLSIFALFVLLLFSFTCYFDPSISNPFGNSLIVYLLLITFVNIIKKNVSFGYHITFAIVSFILLTFHDISLLGSAYDDEDYDENTEQNKAVDPNEGLDDNVTTESEFVPESFESFRKFKKD